jgi:hypothetical protein
MILGLSDFVQYGTLAAAFALFFLFTVSDSLTLAVHSSQARKKRGNSLRVARF